MKKSHQTRAMIAIYAASLLVQAMNSLGLIFQGVQTSFPDTSVAAVQMILSIATLIALIGSLVAGKAAQYMAKKTLLCIAIALMSVGGFVGYFVSFDLIMVYVAAAIAGFGSGMLIPLSSALIAENFDGAKRATVMGAQSVFVNGGGIILQLVGGLLAASFWKNLFLLFIAFLVIDIFVLVVLPKGGVERAIEHEGGKKPKVFTRFLGIMALQGFFVGVFMMVFMSNITLYVFELGIGDEATAGLVTMAFALGATVLGVIIALVMKLFKRYIFAAGLICGAAGLWVLVVADSLPLFLLGAVLIGFGFTMHNTSFYTLAAANCAPSAITLTMSLYTASMNVGMILCPFIITPLASLLGDSLSLCFLVGAIPVTVIAVVSIFTPRALKEYKLSLD